MKLPEVNAGAGDGTLTSATSGEDLDTKVLTAEEKVLTLRGRRREAKYWRQHVKAMKEGKTIPEQRSVGPRAWSDYRRQVADFVEWYAQRAQPVTSAAALDRALARFMTDLFLAGRMCSDGEKLTAGVRAMKPESGE